MKIYLCGPINGCTDEECKNWREAAKSALPGAEFVDPMRRDYRGREDQCAAEIVEGDKADIKGCDVLLVNFPKPSVGTSMEILYAWELTIPVVVVVNPGSAVSPWLRYHSSKIAGSFSEAFKELINLNQ